MIRAANFFKADSSESDMDEEGNKSKVRVEKDVVKKKSEKENVTSESEDGVKKSKKKNKEKRSADSEADDDDNGGKKSKKKKKHNKQSGSDVIGNSESSKGSEGNLSHEEALVNTDDDEENAKGKSSKKKKPSMNSELEENCLNSANGAKKKSKEKKQSEDPKLEGKDNNDGIKYANQIQSESTDAEGNGFKSPKDPKKKKKKQSEDTEDEENNKDSMEDEEKKQSESTEAEGNGFKSPEDPKKKKKKKKMQSEDPEDEENNKDSMEDAEKKKSADSEAEGNDLNFTENAKEKRKKKKKKQSEDLEAEENNNDGGRTKKRKKKESTRSDEDVTTPSSKSAKRVKFSDQVEVFPTEDEESEEEDDEEEVEQVRGKRFTKEEDELIKKAVLEYVENHALGDEGISMVMDCKSHKQIRGCWKEITAALPWRPYAGVYHRAHTLFEQGSKGVWSKEDLELVIEYQKKHGNDWKTLADAMGKHRLHVKDAWRRIRLASKKKGQWSREEYQNLFDLVNKDLRMKVFQEKRSKHGMLRDNIPWMAISDQLLTRDHTICCMKWYDQLTSPMVAKGIWANVDDYRLLDELTSLDAACVDDVDWDNLLDNRDGDTCRSRWNQLVHHIGLPGTKTFAEQVEILSQRYCPDLAEDREDFDNRPFDRED